MPLVHELESFDIFPPEFQLTDGTLGNECRPKTFDLKSAKPSKTVLFRASGGQI